MTPAGKGRPPVRKRPSTAQPDPNDLVTLGRVVKPHGLDGELRVYPFAESESQWDAAMDARLFLASDDRTILRPVRLESLRPHGPFLLVRFKEIPDRTAADDVGKIDLVIHRADLPTLEEGAFYHYQLEGLSVIDSETGEALGQVGAVGETGAQDNLLVRRPDGRTFVIPFVPAFVGDVDLTAGTVKVTLPPGLIDVNE